MNGGWHVSGGHHGPDHIAPMNPVGPAPKSSGTEGFSDPQPEPNEGLLRRAAALMRERAEAATPGPWSNRRGPGEHVVRHDSGAPLAATNTRADRRHIASWHPLVALAVADWLEAQAYSIYVTPDLPSAAAALIAARAYLGEPS